MQLQDSISLLDTAQGFVEIYLLRGEEHLLLAQQHNAIVDNARKIMAKALIGQTALDRVRIFNGPTFLAAQAQVTLTYGDAGTILAPIPYAQVQALFPATSFSGPFDKLALENTAEGEFSELILGSPLTKSSTEQILIIWKIKFI